MHEIIRISDMHKIYNPGASEVRALDGLSLTVCKGEFVAIIGYSGAGKTTLMNMLGCLDTPTSGQYLLEGNSVGNMSKKQLSAIRSRHIGFVFQGFNLISGMTALENVELPLIYRHMHRDRRREIATKSLERVGLGNRIHHKPSEMSGGQQQRVAIARAIASQPPIILADEPTGNLDTASGNEVINTLTDLNKDGHTIVLITHDGSIAARARRIIKVQDGRVVSDEIVASA